MHHNNPPRNDACQAQWRPVTWGYNGGQTVAETPVGCGNSQTRCTNTLPEKCFCLADLCRRMLSHCSPNGSPRPVHAGYGGLCAKKAAIQGTFKTDGTHLAALLDVLFT
mmetsp:Transcript_53923/g.89807  ORF Transcript_53923/g.89807 Transcript_53923/m.89807 type:complete len:109 (+) Transcript_53923:644-970(+)